MAENASTSNLDLREIQAVAWANKQAKGFNVTDVPLEFCYLQKEVSEAFTAWLGGVSDFGEELADVLLFVAGLAQMNGIDLQTEVQRKLAKNATRTYVTGPRGFAVRVEEEQNA